MAETTRTTSAKSAPGTAASADGTERVLAEAKEIGTELATAVRSSAWALLDEQRRRAADQIAAVGEALQCSADSLEEGDVTVAHYVEEAARQINGLADTVRNRPWTALRDDVEDFARRWPLAFVASAVAAGIVAGRFLMSSDRAQTSTSAVAAAPASGSVRGGAPRDRDKPALKVADSAAGNAGQNAPSARDHRS